MSNSNYFEPLMVGVNQLEAYYRVNATLAIGATPIDYWADGRLLVAYKGRAVGVNAYVGDSVGKWSGDYALLIINAGYWLKRGNGSCFEAVCTDGVVINGSLTLTDFTQTDRLFRQDPPSTCATPQSCQGTSIVGPVLYDYHWFMNNSPAAQCVTVRLDPKTCTVSGDGYLHSSAYLGTYNPSDKCMNFLADIGNSPDVASSYSFQVPAWANYTVVVNKTDSSGTCPSYQLTVSAGACPATGVQKNFLPVTIK